MNACSFGMKKLVGFCCIIVAIVSLTNISTVNGNNNIAVNICSESENKSESQFWTDFSTIFNLSFDSPLELNCSSTTESKVDKIPYNLSELSFSKPQQEHLQFNSQVYESDEYCVENISETEITVQSCQKKKTVWELECGSGGTNELCIRKCCQPHEIFTHEEEGGGFRCINSSTVWSPRIYDEDQNGENNSQNISQIRFISSHPRAGWCEFGPYVLDTMEFEGAKYSIRIHKNGHVTVKNHQLQPWRLLQSGTFCVEGILRNNSGSEFMNSEDIVVVDCSPPDEEEQVDQLLYIIFRSVACFFLILTVSVYLILWERQNIHSWTLLGYACCMLFLHISIFATYLHNDRVYLENEQGTESISGDLSCKFLAIISHFLYLSTFCWLTLINFDVFWTFRNLRLTTGRRKQRFLLYLLFAILLPTIVLLLGFVLKKLFEGGEEDGYIIYLEYSTLHCFISDYSALVFKFVPVAILLGCNIILFTLTVVTLYRIGESTKFATNKSSQSDTEKSKFLLFVKLFFVMGLVWTLELVSYFVFGRESTHPVAYVLDVINILQPVAIFIIFVCKADIFRGLQLKLPCLRSLFSCMGLQNLRSRIGSGLSGASVGTQISTTSTRSSNGDSGNQVSFEMMGEPAS